MDSQNSKRLNQSKLAKELGCTRQHINKLVKNNVLKFDSDGLIDVDFAKIQIARTQQRTTNKLVDIHMQKNSLVDSQEVSTELVDNDDKDYFYYKTKTEKWKSLREEISYEKDKRSIVSIVEINQDLLTIINVIKSTFLLQPDQISRELSTIDDALKVREFLDKDIRNRINLANKEIEKLLTKIENDDLTTIEKLEQKEEQELNENDTEV